MSLDFFIEKRKHQINAPRQTAAEDGTICSTAVDAAAVSRELK